MIKYRHPDEMRKSFFETITDFLENLIPGNSLNAAGRASRINGKATLPMMTGLS